MSERTQRINKKLLLIMNPVAGKKRMLKELPDVVELFTLVGYSVTVFPTGGSGDAEEYIKKFGKDFDLICCSGGDGTMGETVSGIVAAGLDVPVGYIPSGSTNDFATFHGIPSDISDAVVNIINGSAKPIDVGVFDDRCFINSAEFGAFTWQAYTTPQRLKNLLGGSAYLLDAIKDLSRLHCEHMKISMDGNEYESDYLFGVLAASCNIADKALKNFRQPVVCDDGLFEVAFVRKPDSLPDKDNLVKAIRNGDPNTKFIRFARCDSVVIESDRPVDWNVDGEKKTVSGRHEIKVLKQRIKLIC